MQIRSESIVFFIPLLLMGIVFIWINIPLVFFFVCVTLFIIYFFRDPEREIPQSKNEVILSPADGKIILKRIVSEEERKEFDVSNEAAKLSIFMSIFNVHVNRAPISGKIVKMEHKKGKKYPAFCKKSSKNNEHMNFEIRNDIMLITFRLIAGLIARRIKSFKKIGDIVTAGERIGMIKFGSRVDIFIPGGWDILVKLNQKVIAGETILARGSEKII